MNRIASFLVMVSLLGAACTGERESVPPGEAAADAGSAAAADVAGSPAGGAQPPAGQPDDGSAAAAAAVIRDYYAAIAARDYARAYGHWSDGGAASGQSFEQFRAGFAETASVTAEVGAPGRVEGAAGSRYVSVPVEVRATTTAGAAQCFRGTYTLRRAVVPGATAEQRSWHIASADIRPCAGSPAQGADAGPSADAKAGNDPAAAGGGTGSAGASGGNDSAADERAAQAAAADLVRRFGQRLARVSLLAPPGTLREEIRTQYAPLVTPALLESWLENPASAPGREVSSPWPDRIEVHDVRRIRPDALEVTGDVVYSASVEATRGGAARREPVVVTVVRGEGGEWRIGEVERAGGS